MPPMCIIQLGGDPERANATVRVWLDQKGRRPVRIVVTGETAWERVREIFDAQGVPRDIVEFRFDAFDTVHHVPTTRDVWDAEASCWLVTGRRHFWRAAKVFQVAGVPLAGAISHDDTAYHPAETRAVWRDTWRVWLWLETGLFVMNPLRWWSVRRLMRAAERRYREVHA